MSAIFFKRKIVFYPVLLLISFLFVLIYCKNASPLGIEIIADNAIFQSMGKMIVDGKIPYKEMFDHKGPVMFYLNAFGQLFFPYKQGILIVETINIFLISVVLFKILQLIGDTKKTILLYLIFLIIVPFLYSGGNFSEGYSMVPLFVSLYIGYKYLFKERKISKTDAFILGLCYSFIVWIRANNAGFLSGVCLFLFISSIRYKDWQSLRNIIIFPILGIIPLSLIIVGYFWHEDALDEMIYGTFTYNVKYLTEYVSIFGRHMWRYLLVLVVLAIGNYMEYRNSRDKNVIYFSVLVYIFSFITSSVGDMYKHYVMLMLPAWMFGFILIVKNIKKSIDPKVIYFFMLAVIILSVIKVISVQTDNRKNAPKIEKYKEDGENIFDKIPESDQKRVYAYLVGTEFYPMFSFNTNYKYFILQEFQGGRDPQIFKEINETMSSGNRPLWVIMEKKQIDKREKNGVVNSGFDNIMDRDYSLYFENDSFILYKLKAEQR